MPTQSGSSTRPVDTSTETTDGGKPMPLSPPTKPDGGKPMPLDEPTSDV